MRTSARHEQPSACNLRGARLRDATTLARQSLWKRPVDPQARTILARAFFERGDDIEAVRLLQQSIYDDPNDRDSYELLIKILHQLRQHDAAVETHKALALAIFRHKP